MDLHVVYGVKRDLTKHRVSKPQSWPAATHLWYLWDDARRADPAGTCFKYYAVRSADDPDWPAQGKLHHPFREEIHMSNSQQQVLNVLFKTGAVSDSDLIHHVKANRFDMTRTSIRTRRSELTKLGLVEAVGQQVSLRGRKETIWDLTPKGVNQFLAAVN